jgi:hypothetical protein
VDRLARRFARDRRVRFGIGGQGAALVSRSRVMSAWRSRLCRCGGRHRRSLTGHPPPAVSVEFVPAFRSPIENSTNPLSDEAATAGGPSMADDALSTASAAASADDAVSPPLAGAASRSTRDDPAAKQLLARSREAAE